MSYDSMDTEDTLGEEMIPDAGVPSVEDIAVNVLLYKKLHDCLSHLTEAEHSLIFALFYEHKSEREYTKILGVSQNSVNKRLQKALTKLRTLMNA